MYELHDACKAGKLALVKKLLELGHNPKEKDIDGNIPLSYAVWGDHYDVTAHLINYVTQEATPSATAERRAVVFFTTGNLFREAGRLDSAIKAYNATIENFESIENRSDLNTELYLGCLQQRLQLTDTINDNDILIELYLKMILGSRSLHQIKEEDQYRYDCVAEHNLAQAWRRIGNIKEAIPAYIRSIAQFPNFSEAISLSYISLTGHLFIRSLAVCFENDSFENEFCVFAADCLYPNTNVIQRMSFLLNNPQEALKADSVLCKLGMILIDTLLHHHKLDALQNISLKEFFEDSSNIQKLKDLRDLLDRKLNPSSYYNPRLAFFGGFTDMDDNSVPLNLDYTHPWTERPLT